MKAILVILLILLTQIAAAVDIRPASMDCPPLLNHNVENLLSGEKVNLCQQYHGSVVVIVNTANKCELAEQYAALENLQDQYGTNGLVILGFHNNDYAGDLEGSPRQDKQYCRLASSIRFPLFSKQRSHPDDATPIFQSLANAAGEYPRWNFHKYVLDREGKLQGSFDSLTDPESPPIVELVRTLL